MKTREERNRVKRSPSTVLGIVMVAVSMAVFGYFVYSASAVGYTNCGTVPCGPGASGTANAHSLTAMSDYIYGLTALLAGQAGTAALILVKKTGSRAQRR